MSFADLISTYGYAAVGVGAFIEGETLVVLGGLAADRGYLDLPWVIFSAATGAVCGDQLFYYFGRIRGRRALERRVSSKRKSEKVFALLDQYQVWFILGFRFLYGFRAISPFIIGVSNISPFRFLVLDIVGATLWATVVSILGYLFGNTIQALFGDIQRYELYVFALLAAVGTVIWLYRFRKKSSANKD
ncbi:MAG: DedA family protein [Acidiferrobacterales bacterium]|nr:DedA family protein [Acidiferrobacterales bacterium]